jgi:hypothetical protein
LDRKLSDRASIKGVKMQEGTALRGDDVVAQPRDGIYVRIIQPQTRIDYSTCGTRCSPNDGLNLKKKW